MDSGKRNILNQLLQKWPAGSVAVSSWLKLLGAYQQLMYEYEKSGWVRRIGRGAYVRAGDEIDWSGGLYAIQQQLALSVHVADKTALQLQGYAHFLPLGQGGTLSLFGLPRTRLPAWFQRYDWGVDLRYTTARLYADKVDMGLTGRKSGTLTVQMSAPERAMMEFLYFVPNQESFEEAALLMEGLTTLRPDLVQKLLEQCCSVKVKRLFMFLAAKSQHPWVEKLDQNRINFGKGKRVIAKEGRLDKRYNITVPESVYEPSDAVGER